MTVKPFFMTMIQIVRILSGSATGPQATALSALKMYSAAILLHAGERYAGRDGNGLSFVVGNL